MGHIKTRGWVSWNVLKKYKLKNADKGKLFLYSDKQAKKVISRIMKKRKENLIDDLIQKYPPNNLEKYKNTFVIADSEKSFYNIFSGETRNIIRDFFSPEKRLVGKCQFRNCTSVRVELDTVHFTKNRPKLFMNCASKNKKKQSNSLWAFDVYQTMRCFLRSHFGRKSVCFLCKKHHNEFHSCETLGRDELKKFKKQVIL